MAITAGAVVPLDEKRRRRHDLLAQLREVDHWRRLVAARLDLAVAAVTSIDEPDAVRGAALGGGLPPGLREILGLPECAEALPEASALLRLRAAQRDLDEYARVLRESSDLATLELATLLDAERAGQRSTRRVRPVRPEARPGGEPHLRVVEDAAGDPDGDTAGDRRGDTPGDPVGDTAGAGPSGPSQDPPNLFAGR